ncbi:MAG: 1-(5-phosphoribosyl)-5-[(5-phosphoribosylamino)methylideneamino]imidazole-4-carboxamide isomerase [Saprospiraceae bacterium]|nr:1-(5-phosphoribosyl)-5-[(5-phosphoribosylamino)methylideneamino]imidazole-4-carboxamide isomerase [Saprospiraceae bacterium]
MRIIPAMDLIGGKCVRLTQGDYSTAKIYTDNPLDMAKIFEDAGCKFLHLVDLDGARNHHVVNIRTLEKIASQTRLTIDFGGGIKTESDLQQVFQSGASQVTVGSIAAVQPDLMISWIEKFGAEKIILGADCKNRKIATHGWKEETDINILSFLQYYEKHGIKHSIVTDINKDGMLEGPAIDLYQEIIPELSVQIIASGGISSMTDIIRVKETGCEGVIIGKALYEGKIQLKELSALC